MTGEPETAPELARIDLLELDQPGYRVWPLADLVADKVTAMFATFGPTNRASTRVKPVIGQVIHGERKAPECRRVAPSRVRVPVLGALLRTSQSNQSGNMPSIPLGADKPASQWTRLAHSVSAVADRRYPGQSGEMLHPGP